MIYESGGGCPKKIPPVSFPFEPVTAGGSHKFSPVGPFLPSLVQRASNKELCFFLFRSGMVWYRGKLERGVMKHSAVS